MANIVQDCITITFSKIVRNDYEADEGIATEEQISLIDATLQEVLDLPDGVIVEVTKG